MVRMDTSNDINKEIDLHTRLRNIKRQKLRQFIGKKSVPLQSTINNNLVLENIKLHKVIAKEADKKRNSTKTPKKKKQRKKYILLSNNFKRVKLLNKNKRNNHWRKYSVKKF